MRARHEYMLVSTLLIAIAFPAVARGDERPLAQLIPADAGMCLEVHNLADHIKRFQSSPQFARLAEFPPWQKWRQKEGKEINKVARQIARYLGVTSEALWVKVLGQRLALAVWPGDEQFEEEAGPAVLLIRAADAETLDRVAAGFRKAQRLFEDVAWQTASRAGITYYVGDVPKKKSKRYLAVRGITAVFSENRLHFLSVLDRFATTGPEGSLAGLEHYQAARRQFPDTAAATVFIHPRPWVPGIRANIEAAPEDKRPGQQLMLDAWQAVHSCSASLTLAPRLAVEAVVRYDQANVPEPVTEFLGSFGGASEFLSKTPADCLLAIAGRLDVDRLVRLALKFKDPDKDPEADGSMLVVQLLRLLGPDVGTYVTASDNGGTNNPLHWAMALGVRPGLPRDELPGVQDLLRGALPVVLAGVAKALNDSAVTQAAGFLGGDGVNVLADGVRASRKAALAFSFSGGHLWAATSRGMMQQAHTVATPDSLAASARWKAHLSPTTARPSYALYLHSAGWREMLERHAEGIVGGVAKKRQAKPETIRRGLDQLLALLRLGDSLVAAIKIDDGLLAFSLSLSVEQP